MSIDKPILRHIFTLQRTTRLHRPLIWLTQLAIIIVAGLAAFLLRFDFVIPFGELPDVALALPIWLLVKAVVFRFEQLDHGWWRFVSIADLGTILQANILGSVLGAIAIRLAVGQSFPRSLYVLDFLVCFMASVGIRIAVRVALEASSQGTQAESGKRVLIYGAGTAGMTLLREIRSDPKLLYTVDGFIDDNPAKSGIRMQGIEVLGGGAAIAEVAPAKKIEEILIAIPSADGSQMTRILNLCHEADVPCKTIPRLSEMMQQSSLANQIRDVAVEDLLGRAPVQLDERRITSKLNGSVAIVTGAGGSIGSELCRQLARFNPEAIVGYEASENALYELDREMKASFPGVRFCPEVGSVQNPRRLADVLALHKPGILFHAAAYKHVPMMESHVFEAVENNIFGTVTAARAACEHGVSDFVMISSDKAVNPTSVMGATKRISELAVKSLQNGSIKYVSVRFGNVLGSNGSCIPLFKKQIAAGGPVTVTHPAMQRYFMTIPEAAQLVLQASTMGSGGEIFVLDMGRPVKIVDLAKDLILLSGLRPGVDVKIEFTGVRPGEKLYEELNLLEESTVPTSHEKIKIFNGPTLGYNEMWSHIEALHEITEARNMADLLLRFKEIIPDYNPSSHVLRRAMGAPGRDAAEVPDAKGAAFSASV